MVSMYSCYKEVYRTTQNKNNIAQYYEDNSCISSFVLSHWLMIFILNIGLQMYQKQRYNNFHKYMFMFLTPTYA